MKNKYSLLILLCIPLVLIGCGLKKGNEADLSPEPTTASYSDFVPGEYDSADTCIVVAKSSVNETITFYNYDLAKYYTLNVDSVTKYADKYGNAISFSQIEAGIPCDICFLKSKKQLTNLTINKDALTYSEITGFSIDTGTKTFVYKSETFKISDKTALICDNEKMTIKELTEYDEVMIVVKDEAIEALIVTKAHGTLKLRGADYFEDGYVEIGADDIRKIEKDKSLIIPEGEYDLLITRNSTKVEKHVVINPYAETVLDLSDVEIEEEKTGKVLFATTPSDAKVYIDGTLINTEKLVELKYGRHQLAASKDGYESLTRYFNVGEKQATLTVDLEEITKDDDPSKKEEDLTEGYFIFVSGPSGVEVFFDGNYIGKAPLSLTKKSGSHSITISKPGYVSRTYPVMIENTAKDVYYSFDELVAETVTSTQTNTTSDTQTSTSSTSSSTSKEAVSGNE